MNHKLKIVTSFTYLQVVNAKWFLILFVLGIGFIFFCTQEDKIANWVMSNEENETTMVAEQKETEEDMRAIVQYFAMIAMLMPMILYGTGIANTVVEEKSSRIIETLLCYAKPIEILSGKILGFVLGMMTHIIAWGLIYIVIFKIANMPNTFLETLSYLMNERVLILFVCSMILGFMLYGFLYAALGAFADSVQDSGPLLYPVLMIPIVVYIVSLIVIKKPEMTWVNLVSYLPFFSSMMSFTVIDLEHITWLEVMIRILVQVVEVILFAIFCSRLYRRGVVSYGIKNLWKRKS